jgi:O-antigen ligase
MRESAGIVGLVFFLIAVVFVWRSFYAMRIPVDK